MIEFWKVQALGNDFVLIDDRDSRATLSPAAIRSICDRHFGIGADGILLVRRADSSAAQYEMVYYNADGTLAEMCGNGIRCFAKFLFDHGLTSIESGLHILTGAGVKIVDLQVAEGKVRSVRVNMGKPRFGRHDIPMVGEGEALAVEIPLPEGASPYAVKGTAVSMGNPHCVVFIDEDPALAPVATVGPLVEHHELFPERTNVQFVRVLSSTEVTARIWERGVGETMASGTSSCAIVAAGVKLGKLERRATVHLPGGDLDIEWSAEGDIYMTGGAEEVFRGEIDLLALETEDA